MANKIFVTGSNGFIGKELITKLSISNFFYTVLDRKNTSFRDIKKLSEFIEGNDFVIHLAGKVQGDEKALIEANVDFTHFLLEAISNLDKKPVLIYASSFAVYGIQDDLLSEESLVKPMSAYGRTKLEAEKVIEKYSKEFKIPSLILRVSNIYGPGMPPYTHSVVANFMDQAVKGLPLTINSTGEQSRDFVYLTDAVDALMRSISLGFQFHGFKIINICSGISISMNELAKEIGNITKNKLKINYPTPDQIDKGNWIGINRKAKRILGWQPKIILKKGIKMYYEKIK